MIITFRTYGTDEPVSSWALGPAGVPRKDDFVWLLVRTVDAFGRGGSTSRQFRVIQVVWREHEINIYCTEMPE